MTQVLLIGCGNIGFRHLQALMARPAAKATDLTIVEPDTAQHARIVAELDGSGITADLRTDLPSDRQRWGLAIIATNANIRRAVFDDLVAVQDPSVILFEKILFQIRSDLDEVEQILAERNIAGFVNCGRRGFPGYQALRAAQSASLPLHLTVTGTKYALASNGIHFFDLAAFLNDSPLVGLDASGLSPDIHASKRAGYKEVFGTLTGRLANGAEINLSCLPADNFRIEVALRSEGGEMHIDEAQGRIIQAGQSAPFEVRHVSGMPELYSDLLDTGTCVLTPYAESAAQHRLYLDALRPHLGLSNDNDDPCPIS